MKTEAIIFPQPDRIAFGQVEVADPEPGDLVDLLAQQAHAGLVHRSGGRHQTGDRVDDGRLTGAVGPDQESQIALEQREVDLVDRLESVEVDGQADRNSRPKARPCSKNASMFAWGASGMMLLVEDRTKPRALPARTNDRSTARRTSWGVPCGKVLVTETQPQTVMGLPARALSFTMSS